MVGVFLQTGSPAGGFIRKLLEKSKCISKIRIQSEVSSVLPNPVTPAHDAALLILPDPLFEEIGLALQADEIHPIERILRFVHLYHEHKFWK